jgi:hypothetical protein
MIMVRLIATFIALILMLCAVNACRHMQADGRAPAAISNAASEDTSRIPSSPNNKTLFKGANMTVIEDGQAVLNEVGIKKPGRSCLATADSIINPKLLTLSPDKNTRYLEFESEQSYSSDSDKFVIKLRREKPIRVMDENRRIRRVYRFAKTVPLEKR